MKDGASVAGGGTLPWQILSFQVLENAISAILTGFFYVSFFHLWGSIEPPKPPFP